MTSRMARMMARWMAVAVLGMTVVSCGTEQQPAASGDESAQAKDGGAAAASFEMTPEIEAKLVAADAFDGSEDHVVSKCASCALHMNGKKEHSAKVGDYTLDFCSADCLTGFTKDLKSKLLALEVPKK